MNSNSPITIMFPKHKTEVTFQNIQRIHQLNDIELLEAQAEKDCIKGGEILEEISVQISNPSCWINRRKYYTYLTIYHNNCAFFHQMAADLDKAQKSMASCVESYEYLKGFLDSREENVGYNIELAKFLLQNCALLSQNGNHQNAYRQAQKALNKLIESFRVLKAICEEEIALSYISPFSKLHSKKVDKICYKTIVLTEARSLLENLAYLPPIHKLIGEQKYYFDKIMSHIYNWKNNDGVSEKAMKKQLDIDDKKQNRSFLGLPKTNKNLTNFNMGVLMTIQLKKINSLCNFNKLVLMFPQKIKEMGLIASVCYFTAGTEGRFSQIQDDMDSLSIVEKYEKLFKNEQIHKSRILHLKAMELAGKISPQSQGYFCHLISSFNKNYKPVLDQIKQQPSISSFYTGCDEASIEYGIDTSSRNVSRRVSMDKNHTKSKISKVLRKYGMED